MVLFSKKMRVLVTGGAGFIGSHTVDTILENSNHEVFVLDNLSTGFITNVPKNVKFYEVDLLDKDLLFKIIEDIKPEIIIHLASSVSVSRSSKKPLFDAQNNIISTLNLMEACKGISKSGKLKKVILASSQTTYGEGEYFCDVCNKRSKPMFRKIEDIQNGKFDLFCNHCKNKLKPIGTRESSVQFPVNNYGVSKLSEEKYLISFANQFGLSCIVFRYFNVYGPRQTTQGLETGVVPIFIHLMLNKKISPIIYEDGLMLRDFVHVKDVAMANYLALDKNDIVVYNVGHEPQTILDLANKIAKELKFDLSNKLSMKCRSINENSGTYDSRAIISDNSKLINEFGFKPLINFEEGLKETIEWAKRNKEIL
jgi:nucleoside-diphosphate-sugar epimerase